jgi:hypothetical protein
MSATELTSFYERKAFMMKCLRIVCMAVVAIIVPMAMIGVARGAEPAESKLSFATISGMVTDGHFVTIPNAVCTNVKQLPAETSIEPIRADGSGSADFNFLAPLGSMKVAVSIHLLCKQGSAERRYSLTFTPASDATVAPSTSVRPNLTAVPASSLKRISPILAPAGWKEVRPTPAQADVTKPAPQVQTPRPNQNASNFVPSLTDPYLNGGWCGYSVFGSSGFANQVQAGWAVPAVAAPAPINNALVDAEKNYVSGLWIGIDGNVGKSTFMQAGTAQYALAEQGVSVSGDPPVPTYFVYFQVEYMAFEEIIPSKTSAVFISNFPVHARDNVYITVAWNKTSKVVSFNFQNLTTKQTTTVNQSVTTPVLAAEGDFVFERNSYGGNATRLAPVGEAFMGHAWIGPGIDNFDFSKAFIAPPSGISGSEWLLTSGSAQDPQLLCIPKDLGGTYIGGTDLIEFDEISPDNT